MNRLHVQVCLTKNLLAAVAGLSITCLPGHADTWRLEAESAGEGTVERQMSLVDVSNPHKRGIHLRIMESDDASGGTYLGGTFDGETHPIACRIPHAGRYRVWVRHYKTTGKPTSFFILFRNDLLEGAGLRYIDFFTRARNVTALPEELPEVPDDAHPEWTWTPCDVTFERPMDASVSFGFGGGLSSGTLGIDCVVVSDDMTFDPNRNDWAGLPAEPGPMRMVDVPHGMQPVQPMTLHSSFFAGAPDRDDQIKLCMVNAYVLYRDYPWILQLGFNRDRGHGGSVKYGIQTQVTPFVGYTALALLRSTPAPEGRRVSATGTVNEKRFSKFYMPYRKAVLDELREEIKNFFDVPEVERYAVIGESGGVFDYSEYSRDAFHEWLKERFGTIDTLNDLWRTNYASFADVALPTSPGPDESKAPWFAFREFSGLGDVVPVAEAIKVINEMDPRQLPCTSQGSCLHINSPWFTSTGSIDFEDMINVGFADSKMFGYDAYSTEDYFIGCDAEFLLSLAGDREVLNGESNQHGQDPRIAARSYWCMVGKGLKGIDIWAFQDHPINWVYSMWGMLNADMTPRDKLAAVSDANHEIHRIERMLRPAKRQHMVKPVALYYSRMDLSLQQPLFDIYGSAIDSPYRIYAVLRGLGYPVRWITPRQIEAGDLKDVGAVALIGVKYVPGAAAKTLAQWVKDGGCIIGDQWPGAFDEYDRQQDAFVPVFGVRAKETEAAALSPEEARIALSEQQTPVYAVDPAVLKSLTADEFYKSVDEMFNQRDSEHPIARAVRNWHLSGYDGKNVEVLSGEIIGQMMGKPGIVVNDYGKGHALYSAIMLGTLYESGPVRFEWDSSREGPGLRNILGAFLRYSGVEPFAEPDMPWGMARKMRIESPLVDAKQNVLIGMISINDGPLEPFPLSLVWPASVPEPKIVLACLGGSRRMEQVPFGIEDGKLKVTMPGFDTHAMLLALQDSDPLVSLEITGVARGRAGLLEVTPNARLTIEATVWNPSPRKLPGGRIRLYGAPGWLCKDSERKAWSIKPFGRRSTTFEVMAPPACAARTLRPLVFKYESKDILSSPCTELVWWAPNEE